MIDHKDVNVKKVIDFSKNYKEDSSPDEYFDFIKSKLLKGIGLEEARNEYNKHKICHAIADFQKQR